MACSHRCQVCGKPVDKPVTCTGCFAIVYCSQKHQSLHRDQLGHAEECARMAAQVARRQEVASHPFPWAPATHCQQPCAWLQQLGLHRTGAWQRECPCSSPEAAPWGAAAPLLRQLLEEAADGPATISREQLRQRLGDWMGLLPCHAPCLLSRTPCSATQPTSWADYYRLRGLPPASPAALLLDAVLTTYVAVQRLQQVLPAALVSQLDGQQQGWQSQQQQQEGQQEGQQQGRRQVCLVLHLLGPQREVDLWPLLLELGCLLPQHVSIELHLIGPEVPAWAHGRSVHVPAPTAETCGRAECSCARQQPAPVTAAAVAAAHYKAPSGSQSLCFWQGAYHELAAELAQWFDEPHAVVAPNAGLAAYMSWVPTLRHLAASMQQAAEGGGAGNSTSGTSSTRIRAPLVCCFTDFNEEAVHRAQQLCGHVLAGGLEGATEQAHDGGAGRTGSGQLVLESGMNAFRKPAAVLAADNALPSASNGFALWLLRWRS